MPEIKHNFTGGKMNKDLDERLIPNGQYRDAMNIQVSTSEGSDVGTVQNILGNIQTTSKINSYWPFPTTYGNPTTQPPSTAPDSILSYSGSIPDEKNDKLYYFLRGGMDVHPPFALTHKDNFNYPSSNEDWSLKLNGIRIYSDHIIEYTPTSISNVNSNTEIVVTDNHTLIYDIHNADGDGDRGFNIYGFAPVSGYNALGFSFNPSKMIAVAMTEVLANKFLIPGATVECWSAGNGFPTNIFAAQGIYPDAKIVNVVEDAHGSTPFTYGGETIRYYKITLNRPAQYSSVQKPEFFAFKTGTLDFPKERTITGINIIDDILFWTDGSSEPKKINITRSKLGSNSAYPAQNTKLIVNDNTVVNYLGDDERIKEKYINVIKRKPKLAPNVVFNSRLRAGEIDGSISNYDFSDASGTLFELGHIGEITIESINGDELNYQQGDDILLLNENSVNNTTAALPFFYDIRMNLTNLITDSSNIKTFEYEISSIASTTPISTNNYFCILSEFESTIYENEMFRIAYRYKYEDGEYSAFSPFSNLCFTPGGFKYDNKNVFNAGMRNYISSMTIEDFADIERTRDVVEIELLLKYENSPNIYLIENIKRSKWISTVSSTGSFNGIYNFNLKNIKGVLPENQLLRTWDNVPKNALSQEIIGNRLVYGNYKQGYNITDNQYFDLIVGKSQRKNVYGIDEYSSGYSVKSQRNYQVGLTWIDIEGRESPVITTENCLINLHKTESSLKNLLTVKMGPSGLVAPDWAISYKYYVKDSSLASYNLVMDTLYLAENGDYWLSFPSSERNKVEEGDYIELKKGMNSSVAVTTELKEKIVAIENEAPDFIKTKYRSLGRAQIEYGSAPANLTFVDSDKPQNGKKFFKMYADTWVREVQGNLGGGGNLTSLNIDKLSVRFEATPSSLNETLRSEMYMVSSVTEYDLDPSTLSVLADILYVVRLEKPISDNDDWIIDPANSSNLEPTLITEFFERLVESRPEHEGRFFAKIHGSNNLLENISPNNIDNDFQEILAAVDVGHFSQTSFMNDIPGIPSGLPTDLLHWFDDSNDSILSWDGNSNAYGAVPQMRWFIDEAMFAGRQNMTVTNELSLVTNQPTANNMFGFRGIFTASAAAEAAFTNNGVTGHIQEGKHYIELSFSGMGQEIFPWPVITYPDGSTSSNVDPAFSAFDINYWFDETVNANSANPGGFAADQNNLIANFFPGTRFRFADDTEIYTILNTPHREFRYNYDDGDEWQTELGDWNGGGSSATLVQDAFEDFGQTYNRRVTYTIEIDKNPVYSPTGYDPMDSSVGSVEVDQKIIFIESALITDEFNSLSTTNPAIWEVQEEPSDKLDIYYEASKQIPVFINNNTNTLFAPLNSIITCPSAPDAIPNGTVIETWGGSAVSLYWPPSAIGGNWLKLSSPIGSANTTITDIISNSIPIYFHTPGGGFVSSIIVDRYGSSPVATYIALKENTVNNLMGLDWSNCVSFRNGVESAFLKDDYNAINIAKGAKVSSTINELYKEEHRKSGLIYSGLYNSTSGINNLNQFIAAEKITKDINPTYGSIQKLHARNTDLITLCEDKVLRILANKDAVYNADGNPQLISTNNVLGQTIPFVGEFGISKNPESFASESYRAYFTDKQRGAVLRLSKDGLTPISDHGMSDWFKDNLKRSNKLIGTYDDKKNEYNVTIKDIHETVSFKEDVRGWMSFKSFVPDGGLSLANEYYTLKDTVLYKHHHEGNVLINGAQRSWPRNTFYQLTTDIELDNYNSTQSSFNVILNDISGSVKSFNALNYEGSQSRVSKLTPSNSGGYNDNEYYNLFDKEGWYVRNIKTDKQKGSLNEFIEKEGKWFNYIKGVDITTANNIPVTDTDGFSSFDVDSFAIQGIGMMSILPQITSVYGCTDPTMFNYNADADYNDGSCMPVILGCTDDTADNYDVSLHANTDDGSCEWRGCTDPTALNYDPQANQEDGSCIAIIYGCTDPTAFNYNIDANVDDGSCLEFVYGCMDATAANYNSLANTSDGSCTYWIYGCMDSNAYNYDSTATASNGSCCTNAGCMDNAMFNYDPVACYDDGSCIPIVLGCTNPIMFNYDSNANTDNGTCILITYGCLDPTATNYDPAANTSGTLADPNIDPCEYAILGCMTSTANNYDPLANTDDGSCEYCEVPFDLQVSSIANTSQVSFIVLWETNEPAAVQSCDLRIRKQNTTTWIHYNVIAQITSPSWEYAPIAPSTDPWQPGTMYEIQVKANCSNTNTTWVAIEHDLPPLIPSIVGCFESTACNYDPTANVAGPCDWTSCAGCTDPVYLEYCPSCTNSLPIGWTGGCNPNCPCTTLIQVGCTDPTMFNYDPNATEACGPVINSCCIPIISGCVDHSAYNYCSSCNSDCNGDPAMPGQIIVPGADYSCCDYDGCMDPLACNYDHAATIQTGLITCCYIEGCTDPSMANYNSNACCDDGSCISSTYGCTDPTALNYNSGVNFDDGSCIYTGCMDPLASNYNPNATIDLNNECVYLGCMDNGTTLSGPNNNITITPLYPGFQACNFNNTATTDDGNQCLWCGIASTLNEIDNYDGATCGTGDGYCTYCWGIEPASNIPTPVIAFHPLVIGQGGGFEVSISFEEAAVVNQPAPISYYSFYISPSSGPSWPPVQINITNSTGWGTGAINYIIGTSDNYGNQGGINLDANTQYNYFLGAYCANSDAENDVFDEEFTTPF